MSFDQIFFDFGNTLVREEPSRFELYAAAAREAGATVETDEMRGLMHRAHGELPREVDGAWRYTDGWFRAYIERIFHGYLGVARNGLGELQEALFRRFSDVELFRLFPGAHELFAALEERGVRLGIISNWSPRLPGLVEHLGLSRFFPVVVCSAIERLEKPDPAIFELALSRAGATPERSLHAGDHPEKDYDAARAVGIESVLVDHAGQEPATDGIARVTSLTDLRTLLMAKLA